MPRASGYLVQWEQETSQGWDKTRAYYPSKDDASSSKQKLESTKGRVRKVEMHPLYKR